MPQKIKSLLPVLSLIILSILIRFFYYSHAPGLWVNEDTYGYYFAASDLLDKGILTDDYRTPVYGLLLHLFMFLSGVYRAEILTPAFFHGAYNLINFQFAAGVISVIIVYKISLACGLKKSHAFFMALFSSFNILLFSFERLLLTESLSSLFLVLFFFLAVRILVRPSKLNISFYLAISILNVFLRPIFILLPVFITPVLILNNLKKRGIVQALTATFFIYFLSLYAYAISNSRLHGYFGISRISDINMLGVILKRDLDIGSARSVDYYYVKVKDYRSKNLEKQPFRFLEYYNITDPSNMENLIKLKEFNSLVIKNDLTNYIFRSLKDIPQAIAETSEKIVLIPPRSPSSTFFNILFLSYKAFQLSFVLVFPLSAISCINFFRKINFTSIIIFILSLISLYQILMSVFLSYGEYGRLISPAQPLIYLYLFMQAGALVKKAFVNKRHSNES